MRSNRWFAALAAATIAAGCSWFHTVYQDDLGTARVSVISVARLADFVDQLSPQYKLSGDDALAQVAPYVSAQDDFLGTAIRLAFGAGAGPSANAEAPDGGTPPAAQTQGDAGIPLAGISPMARFGLATALYQQVVLLNRSTQSFQASGFDLYLIGLDVALMPRRNAEYDADVYIAFSAQCPSDNLRCLGPSSGGDMEVFPLVSQDDLELNRHHLATQKVIELAFALSAAGTIKKTPFEILGEFGISESKVRDVIGRDLNALQVIGRAGRDMIVVRFGASTTVSPAHTLYPQTKRIYVALAVPREIARQSWEIAAAPATASTEARQQAVARQRRTRVRLGTYSRVAFVDMGGSVVPFRDSQALYERLRARFNDGMQPWLRIPSDQTFLWLVAAMHESDESLARRFFEATGYTETIRKPLVGDPNCAERLVAAIAAIPPLHIEREKAVALCNSAKDQRAFNDELWQSRVFDALFLPAVPRIRALLEETQSQLPLSFSSFWLPAPEMDFIDEKAGPLIASASKKSLTVAVPGQQLSTDASRWRLSVAKAELVPASVKALSRSSVQLSFDLPCAKVEASKEAELLQAGACPPAVKLRYRPHCRRVRVASDPVRADGGECAIDDGTLDLYSADWQSAPAQTLEVRLVRFDDSPKEPKVVVQNTPIAAESDGTGTAVVQVDPGDWQKNKKIRFVVRGGSAVLKAGASFEEAMPKTKKLYSLPLQSLVAGQMITIEVDDDDGKPLESASTAVMYRQIPPVLIRPLQPQ